MGRPQGDQWPGGCISRCSSEELRTFHRKLARALCEIAHSNSPWDCSDQPAWFHITLAMHLTERKSDSVMRYVSGREDVGSRKASFMDQFLSLIRRRSAHRRRAPGPLYLPASCLRITVLQEQRIRREYDSGSETMAIPGRRSQRPGVFEDARGPGGLESTSPRHTHGPVEFVIGDLHLGHGNIIRYCARPFSTKNVDEMDDVLVRNWNYCVKPTDRVYFLRRSRSRRKACPGIPSMSQRLNYSYPGESRQRRPGHASGLHREVFRDHLQVGP